MLQDKYEDAARLLDDHEDYKVLRRVTRYTILEKCPEGCKVGIFLDTETTGTDYSKDEVIELGMVPFVYNDENKIIGILKPFSKLRQPSVPISQEIISLTGITDQMVEGQTIDNSEVEEFVSLATVIVAHYATFDRHMVEKYWPVFMDKYWACSVSDINWKAYGFEGVKLGHLLLQFGLFHTGHRAIVDCHSGIELLARELVSGQTGLSILLERVNKVRYRVEATNTPYELNNLLKERRYFWSKVDKVWVCTIDEEQLEEEIDWLQTTIWCNPNIRPKLTKITAKDRFSGRFSTQ